MFAKLQVARLCRIQVLEGVFTNQKVLDLLFGPPGADFANEVQSACQLARSHHFVRGISGLRELRPVVSLPESEYL